MKRIKKSKASRAKKSGKFVYFYNDPMGTTWGPWSASKLRDELDLLFFEDDDRNDLDDTTVWVARKVNKVNKTMKFDKLGYLLVDNGTLVTDETLDGHDALDYLRCETNGKLPDIYLARDIDVGIERVTSVSIPTYVEV